MVDEITAQVNTSGAAGGAAGGAPGVDQGVGDQVSLLLTTLFQGKKTVDGAPITGTNISEETLKIILGPGFKEGKIDLDITFANLAIPDEKLVAIAIEMFAANGWADDHPLNVLLKAVIADALNDYWLGPTGMDKTIDTVVQAAKGTVRPLPPIPGPVACAFLGGLIMVALTELLSEYAKQQSSMDKMMSEMWVKTEAMLKELAKSQAENIQKKAETQARSHIMQACIGASTCLIQVGGSAGALRTLTKGEDLVAGSVKASTLSQKVATINAMTAAVAQSGQVGTHMTQAWENIEVGRRDAVQKIIENIEQQLSKLIDKLTSEGSDAAKKVAEALDLIKSITSALLAAFKGLGGAH